MNKKTVNTLADLGIAANLAAGHAGEMAGAAIEAVGRTTGCPVAKVVGKATQATGRAWADKAVEVGNRDRIRLT